MLNLIVSIKPVFLDYHFILSLLLTFIFNHLLQPILPPVALSGADLERLEHIERQLPLLWEQLQQRDHKQDERHGNILELYSTLEEQLHSRTDRESLGLWVSSLLDQRVGVLHGELQQEHAQRVQVGTGGYVGEWWDSFSSH